VHGVEFGDRIARRVTSAAMSESNDEQAASASDAAAAEGETPPASDAAGFELPDPDRVEAAKLRRRLFGGYRPGDVESALRTREEQIAELRRDVAALWLAFGQHERTIREMLTALERLTGLGVDPPGPQADTPPPTPRSPLPDAGGDIGRQLGDLDQVLLAIEEATQSLERTYQDEITATEPTGAGQAEGEQADGDDETDGETEESS